MTLPPDCEESLRQLVADGAFRTLDEALREAMRLLVQSVQDSHDAEAEARESGQPLFPDRIDIDELARQQGVGPVTDISSLVGDFAPDEENVDEWLQELRMLRKGKVPETRR
ncbi:MAG: hypothetical protein R3C19_26825 [Planctomycetaceae bacterium]